MSINFNNNLGNFATNNKNLKQADVNAKDGNAPKTEATKSGSQLKGSSLNANSRDLTETFMDKFNDLDDGKIDFDGGKPTTKAAKGRGNGKTFGQNLRDIQKESASVEERYRDNEQLAVVDMIRAGWRTWVKKK